MEDKSIIMFGMMFLLVALATSLASADPIGGEASNVITNFTIIQNLSDFVAGDTMNVIFSFDYLNDFNNTENASLVSVVNISSLAEEFPVWRGDFSLEMIAREFFLPEIFGNLFLTDEIPMPCTEFSPIVFNEQDGEDAILVITNVPNVTFYCFNESHHMLETSHRYEITLNISSQQALYPGNYSINIGLFEASPDIIGALDLLILLVNWGPCDSEDCPGDYNGDGVVDNEDLLILLDLWGLGPELLLENITIIEGEALEHQVNATGVNAILNFSVSDTENFFINSSGFLTNATVLSLGDYNIDITLVDYIGREKTESMTVTVLSSANAGNNGDTTSGGGGGGGDDEDEVQFLSSFECPENWVCDGWRECIDGEQTRSCEDFNNCGTLLLRPDLVRECESSIIDLNDVKESSNAGFISRITGAVIGPGGEIRPIGMIMFFALLVAIYAFVAAWRVGKKKK